MQSSLHPVLVELVYLRISQINNCAYGLDMHTRDLLKKGQKIENLAMHRISHLNPEYVSERLAAVENVGRAWVIIVVVAALTFGMSFT